SFSIKKERSVRKTGRFFLFFSGKLTPMKRKEIGSLTFCLLYDCIRLFGGEKIICWKTKKNLWSNTN
ncbi:MAG: hypothetical protein ACI376_03925, partial [Candidatus Bruticola sp.]